MSVNQASLNRGRGCRRRYSTRGYNGCMQPFEIEQALAQAAAKLELMQVYL
jgi:hypothetical protein